MTGDETHWIVGVMAAIAILGVFAGSWLVLWLIAT
jgi:hypothetical protein